MRNYNLTRGLLIAFVCFVSSISTNIVAQSAVEKEFRSDTARVEQKYRIAMEKDYSTLGMIEAMNEYEKDYDVLLNKYYKKLLAAVTEKNKSLVRETQRNWIKLRDSDLELLWAVESETYEAMGGGTMWNLIAVSQQVDITRRRVLEIFAFLTFGDIGG